MPVLQGLWPLRQQSVLISPREAVASIILTLEVSVIMQFSESLLALSKVTHVLSSALREEKQHWHPLPEKARPRCSALWKQEAKTCPETVYAV